MAKSSRIKQSKEEKSTFDNSSVQRGEDADLSEKKTSLLDYLSLSIKFIQKHVKVGAIIITVTAILTCILTAISTDNDARNAMSNTNFLYTQVAQNDMQRDQDKDSFATQIARFDKQDREQGNFFATQIAQADEENHNLATQVAALTSRPTLYAVAMAKAETHIEFQSAQGDMIDEWFNYAMELSKNDSSVPYHKIVERIPPIVREIPAAPTEITTVITNEGNNIARNVSIHVVWESEILRISVDSLSRYTILAGGLGSNEVLILLDRIAVDETAKIIIAYSSTVGSVDIVELALEDSISSAQATGTPPSSKTFSLPTFRIVPDEKSPSYDMIQVQISSDETPMYEVRVYEATDSRFSFNGSVVSSGFTQESVPSDSW